MAKCPAILFGSKIINSGDMVLGSRAGANFSVVILRKIPGLYAFVVDGLVQYIRKAETHLRGRVRNYNRCLIDNPLRPHRDAHGGIARALKKGKTVDVYIRIATAGDNVSALETTWIRELNPVWNKT